MVSYRVVDLAGVNLQCDVAIDGVIPAGHDLLILPE